VVKRFHQVSSVIPRLEPNLFRHSRIGQIEINIEQPLREREGTLDRSLRGGLARRSFPDGCLLLLSRREVLLSFVFQAGSPALASLFARKGA
jgi:hypothetical protein